MSVDKALLRAMTESVYALQSVRIVTGNRIVQAWYRTHGVEPGTKPDVELDAGDKTLLEKIRRDYKRLTDGLVTLPRRAKFEPTDYLSNYAELNLVRTYEHTLKAEDVAVKALEGEVQEHPMWRGYLAGIRGCGPLMAAALLCYLDPHKAEHVSQFWSYAGLAVASDGTAQSRRGSTPDRARVRRQGRRDQDQEKRDVQSVDADQDARAGDLPAEGQQPVQAALRRLQETAGEHAAAGRAGGDRGATARIDPGLVDGEQGASAQRCDAVHGQELPGGFLAGVAASRGVASDRVVRPGEARAAAAQQGRSLDDLVDPVATQRASYPQ